MGLSLSTQQFIKKSVPEAGRGTRNSGKLPPHRKNPSKSPYQKPVAGPKTPGNYRHIAKIRQRVRIKSRSRDQKLPEITATTQQSIKKSVPEAGRGTRNSGKLPPHRKNPSKSPYQKPAAGSETPGNYRHHAAIHQKVRTKSRPGDPKLREITATTQQFIKKSVPEAHKRKACVLKYSTRRRSKDVSEGHRMYQKNLEMYQKA